MVCCGVRRIVVWCGVVWCGVVWCGVVWCGVVWCGVAWCGVVSCGVVWWGVVWCGVVWCGVVWCGVVCRRRCYQMAKGRDVYPRAKVNGLGCVCCVHAVCRCVVAWPDQCTLALGRHCPADACAQSHRVSLVHCTLRAALHHQCFLCGATLLGAVHYTALCVPCSTLVVGRGQWAG